MDGEQDNKDSSTTPEAVIDDGSAREQEEDNDHSSTNQDNEHSSTNQSSWDDDENESGNDDENKALMMKAKQSSLKRMTMKMKNKWKMKTTLGHNKQKKDVVAAQRKEGGSLYKKNLCIYG